MPRPRQLTDQSLTAGLCSPHQLAFFIQQYLLDMDCEAAAERVGLARGVGMALIRRPQVQKAIRLAQSRRPQQAQRVEQMQDRLWEMSNADLREIIAPVYRNCRHCWGRDHMYQYTRDEMRRARQRHEEKLRWMDNGYSAPFDLLGGDGFDPMRDPNPDCTECGGQGILTAHITDSRKWSPQAALLYDGVEQTPSGLRVKTRNRDHTDSILANNLGLTRTRIAHEIESAARDPAKVPADKLDAYLEALGIARDQTEIIDVTPTSETNE